MVFSSSIFLFAFLPLFLLVYYAMPQRLGKNVFLLVASLVFYAWGEPVYVLLMVVSILFNWIFGLALGKSENKKACTTILFLAVLFNCLVIGFFKYESFVASNIQMIVGVELIPDLELPLPIGISFYTLQALSYVIDVYRGDVEPQNNPLFLGMYIACFPQLIAGPIVRYQTIEHQILDRSESRTNFVSGLRLFIIGLAKKALLANTVAILANKMLFMGGAEIGAIGAWSGLIAYTFQIYFDFSGYSDMAIGLGRMMGFEYLRNFNYPYISKSITEFWRRWHISLSTFFRDYVYIPLGGSRCKRSRWVLNIAVVWTITGLWHGADWNYVGWGAYYGLLLICEKLFWGKKLGTAPVFFQHVYTIAVFIFGWSFFWITDTNTLIEFWRALVGAYGPTGSSTLWELTAWEYWPVLLVCVMASTPIAPYAKFRFLAWVEGKVPEGFSEKGVINTRCIESDSLCTFEAHPASSSKRTLYLTVYVLWHLVLAALFYMCCAAIVSGSFNPFIYFQF